MGNKFEEGAKSKNGTVASKRVGRLAQLAGNGVGAAGRASWGDINPEIILALLIVITNMGGAISFGQSRDGGAYSVTVFLDGDRRTEWVAGDEFAEERLWRIHEMFAALL